MTKKSFTQDELDSIKRLQDKYNALGSQLVQLRIAISNTASYQASLLEQQNMLDQQVMETSAEEKQLAQTLDAKFGAGMLEQHLVLVVLVVMDFV